MSFWGSSFIFDDVQSEVYDLRLFDFEPSNPSSIGEGGDALINEQWLYRREVPYFYGRYYESPLEFDFTVGSFSPIDGATRHAISAWLLGRSNYLPLRIVQDDIVDITFNVIFTISPRLYVGNLNYALSLHARCDRPWGLYYPPTFVRTYTINPVSDTANYYNMSTYGGYNKPITTFTMNSAGGTCTIVNQTDNNRTFTFTGLSPYETMTVDNDKGTIVSSASALRMTNFNKNFFRLIQGSNDLTISGNISSLYIDAVFSRGVGV